MNNGTLVTKPPLALPNGLLPVRPQPKRIIAAIRGQAKEGKTTLALDFPAPVVIFNFDYGYEAAARYILSKTPGKEIYHFDMPVTNDTTTEEMSKIVTDFQAKYVECLRYCDARGGTVVVDTASDLWRCIQEGILGPIKASYDARKKFMPQFEYGKANLVMAGILRRPFLFDNVNAVFIHRNRVVYDGGEPTSRTEGQWFGDTPAIVEHVFHVYEDLSDKKIKAHIEVCRTDRTMRGAVLANPTYDLIWSMLGPVETEASSAGA